MNIPVNKAYIGDSVYVAIEHNTICLTTENGNAPSNTIYLEPEVWRALKAWVEALDAGVVEFIEEELKEPDADMGRMEHDDKGDN